MQSTSLSPNSLYARAARRYHFPAIPRQATPFTLRSEEWPDLIPAHPKEPVKRFTPFTDAILSHGMLLFNKEGNLLVIKRAHSYGFSSFLSVILGTETTDVPLAIACERLLSECTQEELDLVKANWEEKRFGAFLRRALDVMNKYPYLHRARIGMLSRYQEHFIDINTRWTTLLKTLKIQGLISGQARVHDFPKGRSDDRFSLKKVLANLYCEVGVNLNTKATFKSWYCVSYTTSNNTCYRFNLLATVCDDLKVHRDYIFWIPISQLKVSPEIAEVVAKARQRCFS